MKKNAYALHTALGNLQGLTPRTPCNSARRAWSRPGWGLAAMHSERGAGLSDVARGPHLLLALGGETVAWTVLGPTATNWPIPTTSLLSP